MLRLRARLRWWVVLAAALATASSHVKRQRSEGTLTPALSQRERGTGVVGAIVQAKDVTAARALARSVGATITHELDIIHAVGVDATAAQLAALESSAGARVYRDRPVELAGGISGFLQDSFYPAQIGADRLHALRITGRGVAVAVLDTGAEMPVRERNMVKVAVSYDAPRDRNVGPDRSGRYEDDNGHGTHVSSVALSGLSAPNGKYNGVAPDARLAIVKAFDAQGRGSYRDVIRGIDWVVRHAAEHGIQVLNCSFSATPQSHYWDDPINQAIMRAWQAGIVVVASAGNTGPEPMTVGVPGNVPYVISVGAMTDNYTPTELTDDRLTSFSAAGPTHEGFVKPEILAPGGHVLGMMRFSSAIAMEHPEFHAGANAEVPYFQMSGTSQAAAVVSGAAALILQSNPGLSPDNVKCRLMASARPFRTTTGELAYSVFQQGAGNINVFDAVESSAYDCANTGLDVNLDLAGDEHYGGAARYDSEQGYYLTDVEGSGFTWNNAFGWNQGFTWNQGFSWNNTFGWNQGFTWSGGYTWNQAFSWNNGFAWNSGLTAGTSATPSINVWVNQQ